MRTPTQHAQNGPDPTRTRRHILTIGALTTALTLSSPPITATTPPDTPPTTVQTADRAAIQKDHARITRLSHDIEARVHAGKSTRSAQRVAAPPTPTLSALILRTILSLILVCGVAYAALRWGFARAITGRADDRVRLLARKAIEPKRSLLVVQVASRVLVLASSESGLQTLAELSGEDAAQFRTPRDEALIGQTAPTST